MLTPLLPEREARADRFMNEEHQYEKSPSRRSSEIRHEKTIENGFHLANAKYY
jgi:hypothetical protein